MSIPSHVMGSGTPAQTTRAICGPGDTGLVATGTTQTDALQLSKPRNVITTSSASTGVKLPPCEEGAEIFIYNLAGQDLKIYTKETSGVTMNAAVAGSTGVVLGNTKTAIAFGSSATTWVVTCALTST